MKFGPVPVEEAVGAIAAHSVRSGEAVVRKGSTLREEDARRLRAAGIESVVAVRLDPGDVGEDAAALRLAEALAGDHAAVERPFPVVDQAIPGGDGAAVEGFPGRLQVARVPLRRPLPAAGSSPRAPGSSRCTPSTSRGSPPPTACPTG